MESMSFISLRPASIFRSGSTTDLSPFSSAMTSLDLVSSFQKSGLDISVSINVMRFALSSASKITS